MRRQYTLMAIAAMTQLLSVGINPIGINPTARFSESPYFMPSKSQRVKNKLNRKRYGR